MDTESLWTQGNIAREKRKASAQKEKAYLSIGT